MPDRYEVPEPLAAFDATMADGTVIQGPPARQPRRPAHPPQPRQRPVRRRLLPVLVAPHRALRPLRVRPPQPRPESRRRAGDAQHRRLRRRLRRRARRHRRALRGEAHDRRLPLRLGAGGAPPRAGQRRLRGACALRRPRLQARPDARRDGRPVRTGRRRNPPPPRPLRVPRGARREPPPATPCTSASVPACPTSSPRPSSVPAGDGRRVRALLPQGVRGPGLRRRRPLVRPGRPRRPALPHQGHRLRPDDPLLLLPRRRPERGSSRPTTTSSPTPATSSS